MSVEEIVKKITQNCEDLRATYANLAAQAAPALEDLETSIGRITQWKYVLSRRGTVEETYRDVKMSWFEKLGFYASGFAVLAEEQVPHPEAPAARKRVEELLGKANSNDKHFQLNVDDIANTPITIGKFLITWLRIRDTLAREVVIPSDAAYIRTKAPAGWESPIASGTYGVVLASQSNAASVTTNVISGLLNSSAKFLESLAGNLADYGAITTGLQQYYSKVVTDVAGFAEPPSMATIGQLIDAGFSAVNGLKEVEAEKNVAFGKMATKNIQDLLDIESLNVMVNDPGEVRGDDGWPAPIAVAGADNGRRNRRQLVMDARFFTDHAAFWDDISTRLSALGTRAAGVEEIPAMFTRVPSFTANQSTALNALSDRIAKDLLKKGSAATADLADKLETARHAYLVREADNAAEVAAIEKEIAGG
ncbi:hypothetical protein [Amycolatopsis suaedae]|uniref:Uncharacterized protein n=1 Tax=Amycolatopsis suaedae TaxID=2510978 RepID=A0A4Q7J440_9PSEU|nr:hypothetical protein [Amycolatopsis suaedae]RZQ61436.1 hypothetical protein EWH70_23960 [Amycolatopsis suaedae]